MQDREHDLDRGPLLLLVHGHGDAAPVVHDGHRIVGVDGHLDGVAVTGEGLVDRVVDDLVDQVMQAPRARRTDVHAGAPAHRLATLEDRDVLGVVAASGALAGRRWAILPLGLGGLGWVLRHGPPAYMRNPDSAAPNARVGDACLRYIRIAQDAVAPDVRTPQKSLQTRRKLARRSSPWKGSVTRVCDRRWRRTAGAGPGRLRAPD